ncbi:hypothetical protein H5A34_10530 [Pectobacterium brasiliense]|uniref:hypothetical protein n=1 Tax=Pectobacterium brasiliense TaxID=180957 RepID=UPI000690C664|nr:hypothetical protein [Pectobacterium brasiliense]MBN3068538.1 hypothetical protein [Pectobacterium brasiliense]MBN3246598.1 hypothetical protein [Pectobacterium brasiliense]
MIKEIKDILGSAISATPVTPSSLSDIFEAYVFTLILRASQAEGAKVHFLSRDGNAASSLILRTSPGYIYSSAKNYTYAVIEFPKRPALEMHTGIKVAGKSGVLHEFDVAVLGRAEAENCRLNSVSPRSSKVLIGTECKYYTSPLQLHLARGFVGLVADISTKNPFFVTNTSSESVERLLSHRVKNGWEKDITPTCTNSEVERLINAFRKAFMNYKAQ